MQQQIQIMFKNGVYNYPWTPVCVAANRVYSGFNASYAQSLCESEIQTTCSSDAAVLYRCNTRVQNYSQNMESFLQDALASFFLYNGTTVSISTPLYTDVPFVLGIVLSFNILCMLCIIAFLITQ